MPFRSALSGINAASEDLKVIGNNVANASTTGFKQSRAEFADVYAATQGGSSNAIGSGVRLSSVNQQFGQGNIEFTDNKMDLALNGRGFFVLDNN
ncbi:MAG: flagellar hook-basal body complex protein, partial [Pseudohongiellaceae bacterium]